MSPLIEKLINRGIEGLEKTHDRIISTRIALEREQGRRRTGNPYRMRIDIRIPDRADIVVNRSSMTARKVPAPLEPLPSQIVPESDSEPEENPFEGRSPLHKRGVREETLQTLVRKTFDSARRELVKVADKQRGDVKTPAYQQTQAVVEKIFRKEGYGFLRAPDGQIYFHQNSVLHNHWPRLTVGTIVRYTPETGEKGLQASTVEPMEKEGVAELHGRLHDIPDIP
jgi:cold shock CspA family protein